jgi:hypothetical protein
VAAQRAALRALQGKNRVQVRQELDDKTMQATRPATYLDPEAAAVAIEAVANQGTR